MFRRIISSGDAMKTVRVLLYPDETQIGVLESLCEAYSLFLLSKVVKNQWAIPIEDMPKVLCISSKIQLLRDVHRRLRPNARTNLRLPHRYCRWGEDYRLSETKVVLPFSDGFKATELNIDCIYRPFQKKLLESKHPETLMLKKINEHWYAYMLVTGDI